MSGRGPTFVISADEIFRLTGMRSTGGAGELGPMRCLIVDDSQEFLDAARTLLVGEGFDVVGTASTSHEALKLVAKVRPEVVLVDVNLGTESGFALARALNEAPTPERTPVILISTHAEDDYAELLESSPAIGFLSKSAVSGNGIRAVLDSRN
jgi:DNA-binding NarL/FixJ family response regulator